MFLFSLLPIFCFLLVYLVVFAKLTRVGAAASGRKSVLYAALLVSLFIAMVTEGLSAFRLVTFNALLICWSVPTAALLCYILFLDRSVAASAAIIRKRFREYFSGKLVIAIASALVISLLVALAYPPNNYDSMTYHMARVAHWQQDASIDHYRTHILRQIEFPPFAEWVILHLQILTGGDRFANAVQLFYFAATIVAVSMIALQLGGNRMQQLISALVACFVPMALIQSNTTQNDIVVSFYVACFVYLSLKLFTQFKWVYILFSGIALGVAWLTKGTAYLFTAVFCAWFALMIIKNFRQPFRLLVRTVAAYALVPIIAICINAGHYDRNIFFAGSPLGNAGEGTAIEGFDVRQIALISIKNLMNHLPVTSAMKLKVAHAATRMGIDPDDARYNLVGINSMAEGFSFHEDYAQNFPDVLLIVLFLLIYFTRKETYSHRNTYLLFVLSVVASAFLFCALLQWQPWANRLQTPLFMLFSVFIGIETGKLARTWQRRAIYLPLMAYGYIALFLSSRHPLLPVSQSIFNKPYNYFAYTDGFLEMGRYIDSRPIKKIGIYIGSDTYDYPYYKLLSGSGANKRMLRHVFVHNNSTIYLEKFNPDAIISLESSVKSYTLANRVYYQTKIFKDYVVFEAK